jgi:hypothetical protein
LRDFSHVLAMQADCPVGRAAWSPGNARVADRASRRAVVVLNPEESTRALRQLLDGRGSANIDPNGATVSPAEHLPALDSPGRWLSIQIKDLLNRCRTVELYAVGQRSRETVCRSRAQPTLPHAAQALPQRSNASQAN